MPGLYGLFAQTSPHFNQQALIECIDPCAACETRLLHTHNGIMACSWLRSDSLANRFHEDLDIVGCFSGDLIDYQSIPWDKIKACLLQRRYGFLATLKGTFALSLYDKNKNRVFIVSDRNSQYPIFYAHEETGFVFSSAIGTFCRCMREPLFNEMWLYEFLYFNYPIGQTAIVRDVFKMPPASVLECKTGGPAHTMIVYADPFKRSKKLLSGNESFERALSVFNDRVPKYYAATGITAVSLTGGFDSRTVLAFGPPDKPVETYTYGVDGCGDLQDAFSIARMLGLSHHEIIFDASFTCELPELIHTTVYLSGGQERISRATLPYVYRMLTKEKTEFPVVLTGISGDHLFRDHINGKGNVPAIISADMMKTIQAGRVVCDSAFFKQAFGEKYPAFEHRISEKVRWLGERFGKLNIPESYLSYLVYEVAPRYFAGEAAVAGNYTLLRSPFWDPEIIQLAYDIEAGTLGFSESLAQKDRYLERVLQARLICSKSTYASIPIDGIPLTMYARNSKLRYRFNRFLRKVPKKMKSLVRPVPYHPLENWQYWFDTALDSEVRNILGDQPEIFRYVSENFIDDILKKRSTHWLGKLVTAEIIMRLVGKRWSSS